MWKNAEKRNGCLSKYHNFLMDCIAGAILAKLKLDAQTKEQKEKEAG